MHLSPYLKTAAVVLLSSGCSRGFHGGTSLSPQLPGKASKVIEAQNSFAFRLLGQVLAGDASDAKNMLISPVSIFMDLGMVYNGAASSSREGIATTLGIGDVPTELVNATHQAQLTLLPTEDPAVTLSAANAIWYRNSGSAPLAGFLKTAKTYYKAQVSGAPFDASTLSEINDWVSDQTRGKITSILDKIEPSDEMYLLNAVYFKGQWRNAFDAAVTTPAAFHSPAGDLQVPFMAREARYNYLATDSVQLIELPYGNGDFSMLVALPAQGVDISAWVQAMDGTRFSSLTAGMDSSKVKLRLPKWQYAYQIPDLKGDLSRMGMGEAFTPKADFSGMYPPGERYAISKALHKAFIQVTEEGTEAAAVTSIGISVTSMPLHPTPVMDVNRPFFYVIREKKSGSILFMGIVSNPKEN